MNDNFLQYKLLEEELKNYLKNKKVRDKELLEQILDLFYKYKEKDLSKKEEKQKMIKELNKVMDNNLEEEKQNNKEFLKTIDKKSYSVSLFIVGSILNKKITKKDYKRITNKTNNNIDDIYYGLSLEERLNRNSIENAYKINSLITNNTINKVNNNTTKNNLQEIIENKSKKEILLLEDRSVININNNQVETFKNFDIEYVQFLATLDKRTTKICRELDGNIYKVDDPNIPIPILKTHSRCRSVLIPYIKNEDIQEKRKEGTTKKVIDYKTYKEWVKKYE